MAIRLSYRTVGDPRPQVVLAPVGRSQVPDAPHPADAADPRLTAWLRQSLKDLRALEVSDPEQPDDHFLAAGVPWYLTLFGRDSLIAASMLLPLGTDLAAGTLRALARRQGSRVDPESAEEPGKIAHELRRGATSFGTGLSLPAVYYGTVDATALWIVLLHDSWRRGMPADQVMALLPNLQRALAWLWDYGQDDSGFIRYLDRSGHGLANQGWKDSVDAVQFRDGRLAAAPLALAEVQGYGYAAALAGAELLEAFDLSGAGQARTWAAELADRFRQRFWLNDADGPYPAMALAADGTPVDSIASNMGHLLGTGLLTTDEAAAVVARLGSAAMSSGFGLRTMADSSAGFNPLSYHCGSVWTHDTAIAVTGLADATTAGVTGAAEVCAELIEGLLAAAASFDYRIPELHSGERASGNARAAAYPASCRPQAWSAASAIAVYAAVHKLG